MATQEVAHAVAGAVAVGHRLLPKGHAGKGIELHASGAHWELGTAQGKMPFEHEGEVVFFLLGGVAQSHGAGDVGGAVKILRAAVHEQQSLALQGAGALGIGSVVNDGAMLTVAGNHLKAVAAVEVALGALHLATLPHVEFVDGARWRCLFNPLEQAHQCRSVALHSMAETVDLNLVLDGFERLDRR